MVSFQAKLLQIRPERQANNYIWTRMHLFVCVHRKCRLGVTENRVLPVGAKVKRSKAARVQSNGPELEAPISIARPATVEAFVWLVGEGATCTAMHTVTHSSGRACLVCPVAQQNRKNPASSHKKVHKWQVHVLAWQERLSLDEKGQDRSERA